MSISGPGKLGRSYSERISAVTSAIGTLLSLAAAFRNYRGSLRDIALYVALVLLFLTVLSTPVAWRRFRARRSSGARSQPSVPNIPLPPTRNHLRGLLPFEDGETLPGPQTDLRRVFTALSSTDFRFGCLFGEAGSGKTSLLRAGLLTALRADGTQVVYVRSAGNDPIGQIKPLIDSGHSVLPKLEHPTSLQELLAETAGSLRPHTRVLVVWDQFEEFLGPETSRTRRAEFFRQLALCVEGNSRALTTCFLLVLRTEFVGSLVPHLQRHTGLSSVNAFMLLPGWDEEAALSFIAAAVQHDCAGIPLDVQRALVAGLCRDGQIRPAELQIVATHIRNKGIRDLAAFRRLGGSPGTLREFVKSVIAPAGGSISPMDRETTRCVLRCLCPVESDALERPMRLTQGLTATEVKSRVRRMLKDSPGGPFAGSDRLTNRAVDVALSTCVKNYVVAVDDVGRYNLAHDYVVRPVLDATAGLDSPTDRANRLLQQYVYHFKETAQLGIPIRQRRFIRRFASPGHLKNPDARDLFLKLQRQTKRRMVLGTSFGASAAALLAFLVLPRGESFSLAILADYDQIAGFRRAEPSLNVGGTAAVLLPFDRSTGRGDQESKSPDPVYWDLRGDWRARRRIRGVGSQRRFVASQDFRFVVYCNPKSGNLHLLSAKDGFRARPRVGAEPADSQIYGFRLGEATVPQRWGGFSPGGKWLHYRRADGSQCLVDVDAPSRTGCVPPSSGELPTTASAAGRVVAGPRIAFSPDDDWVFTADDNGVVTAARTRDVADGLQAKGLVLPITSRPYSSFESGIRGLQFGPQAGLFSARDDKKGLFLCRLPTDEGDPCVHLLSGVRPKRAWGRPTFSPDGRWLVAWETDDRIVVFETQREPPTDRGDSLSFRTVECDGAPDQQDGTSPFRKVVFNPDGRYAAVIVSNGALCGFELDATGRVEGEQLGIDATSRHDSVAVSKDGIVSWTDEEGDTYVRTLSPGAASRRVTTNPRPVGVRNTFSSDGRWLLSVSPSDVYFGPVGHALSHVGTTYPDLLRDYVVAPDRTALLLFSDRRVYRAQREWRLFGIPLRRPDWPAMDLKRRLVPEDL